MNLGEEGVGNLGSVALRTLRLESFRNFRSAVVEAPEGVTLLVGANGMGKTNLLEAVHVSATGRLMRGRKDGQAVMEGEPQARVAAFFDPPPVEVDVTIPDAGRKSVSVNGTRLRRAADLSGRLPCVCFTSESLEIVEGEPEERRTFLDVESAQLHPAYVTTLANHKRALTHRNALLRQSRETLAPDEAFEPWESLIAAHGAEVRRHRAGWVRTLAKEFEAAYVYLGGSEAVQIEYVPHDDAESAEEIGARLRAGRARDVERGSTSAGPHRDDLAIRLDGRVARDFGSQGQKRTAVLALKLAVFRTLARDLRRLPILLLDDVFSDLDAARRARLVQAALDAGCQTWLTCTEPEQVGKTFLQSACVLRVTSGAVARA
jgi:DNA replication and repair protein RecF